MEHNSARNQQIKRKLVEREVIHLASTLVYELAQKAEEFEDYSDDLYGAFEGMPDYEESARDENWMPVEDYKGKDKIDEDATFLNVDGESQIFDQSCEDDWQNLCYEQNIEAYRPEIFEHWIITDWFAKRLEEHNHKVMEDFFGLTIWCRPTSGQAILLDDVVGRIAEEMEILEGQKNEWKD